GRYARDATRACESFGRSSRDHPAGVLRRVAVRRNRDAIGNSDEHGEDARLLCEAAIEARIDAPRRRGDAMTTGESDAVREPHVALDEYVAGALSPDEQRAVESHIYECDECRAALDATRRLHVQVRSAFDAESGPKERVRREVFAQIAGTPRANAPPPA